MPSSKRQRAANQQNALVSTGPKTAVGKVRSSRNALQHGLRSSMIVLPDVEAAAAWKAHLTAVVVALAPADYVEDILAERVALLSWRLNRVARYEHDAAALRLESVVVDVADAARFKANLRGDYGMTDTHPDDIRSSAAFAQAASHIFAWLATAADEEPPPEAGYLGTAGGLVSTAFALAREDSEAAWEEFPWDFLPWLQDEREPDGFVEATEWDGWTAGLLRQALATIADRYGVPDLLERLEGELRSKEALCQGKVEALERELEALRRGRLLPDTPTLDKVIRYEAHLERGLYRALGELRDLQARDGRPAAVVVIDHTQDPEAKEGS